MLRISLRAATTALAFLLFGCGGGGGGSTDTATTYKAPPLGQTVDYAVTDTDNSMNSIHWQLEFKVLSSSANGFTQSAIGNGPITVNGTAYGTTNQVSVYNASYALVSYTIEGTTPVVCTYAAPYPPAPNLAAGVAWPSLVDDLTCSDSHNYQNTRDQGSEVDVESVTVPAGTFSAKKLQYQFVSVGPDSDQVITEAVTLWYDTVTGRKVQSTVDYSYAGFTLTAGYRTHELQQLLTAP